MKATEIFQKFFAELSAVETSGVELAQAKLDNGTVLEAESFEAGQPIFIVSEEDRIAVPVGEYKMEDGRILVVVEEGVIGEIKEAAAEAEEEEAPEVEVEVEAAAEPTMEDKIKEVVMPILEEMRAEMSAMKEEMGAYKKKQEMSSDMPAAMPIRHNPEAAPAPARVNLAQNAPESAIDRVLARLNK
jgi:hypothetical protein